MFYKYRILSLESQVRILGYDVDEMRKKYYELSEIIHSHLVEQPQKLVPENKWKHR